MNLHALNAALLDLVSTAALGLFAIEAVARLGIMTVVAIKRAWSGRE